MKLSFKVKILDKNEYFGLQKMVLAWMARLGARPRFLAPNFSVRVDNGEVSATAKRLLGNCKAKNTLKCYDQIIRYSSSIQGQVILALRDFEEWLD